MAISFNQMQHSDYGIRAFLALLHSQMGETIHVLFLKWRIASEW
jgi:hypothetical protein